MTEFSEFEKFDFPEVDQEIILAYKKYNIWHGLQGFFFYSKPWDTSFSGTGLLVAFNCHQIVETNSLTPVDLIHTSNIITRTCQKLWPLQHQIFERLNNSLTLESCYSCKESGILLSWTSDIHNYYHLMMDLGRRLICIEKNMQNPPYPSSIFIVGPENKLVVQMIKSLFPKSFLTLKFINCSCVNFLSSISLPNVIEPSYMDSEAVNILSSRIKERIAVASSQYKTSFADQILIHPIIYARRGSGKNGRQIQKEHILERLLEDNVGAYSINFADYSLEEQWYIANNAKVIISPHGAALTNILACNRNTIIIELLPSTFRPATFSFISKILELKHKRIIYNDTDNITTNFYDINQSIRQFLRGENILI